MVSAYAIAALLFSMSAAFVVMTWVMTYRLTPERKRRAMLRWLMIWSGKAAGLPLLGWSVMNLGISWRLQPFMPQIQAAQNSGAPWFPEWLKVVSAGMFILSSYWSSGTLVWVLYNTSRVVDPEPRKDFRGLAVTCCLGLGIPALLVGLLGGWAMAGFAAAIVIAPMAGYAPAILKPQQLPPMYARAIARMKFGKYSEAEWEIIHELEKCEDDFEGWLMLAALYATNYHDVPEAERTIMEICDQPTLTPSQLSIALHRLADWQVKIGADPEAARRSLQIIVDRLRGSHLARMAQLRMNQLPQSREELREQEQTRAIPLPALGDKLDAEGAGEEPRMERRQAASQANACVEQLKRDPNLVPAREKLARLFAEQLERAELGVEQLQLLLDMPDQPDAKRAEWLALLAAWHIKHLGDTETGQRLLQRLAGEFPGTPQAFAARNRLERMKSGQARTQQAAVDMAPDPTQLP